MATVAALKDDLEGLVHSTNLNAVQNPYKLFERAARKMLSKIDPPETIRVAQIANVIHANIYDYAGPSDLKGEKVIDIRPQINRVESDVVGHEYLKEFDLRKANNTFTIGRNKGVKSIRLSKSISPSPASIHDMDSITGNGTWAADGAGATNLTKDELDYVEGGACLNFDLIATGVATSAYIQNSTFTAVDLTDLDEIGQFFVWVYLPDTSIITSLGLRWGSDTTNYWSATATYPFDQSAFKTGWNLVKFNWNGATESVAGGVDPSAIDYLRVTVTYDGTAETDIRIDGIICSAGEIWEIVYYSDCIFQRAAGTWANTITDDAETIILEGDTYEIFLDECGLAMAQQLQGEDADFDRKFFSNALYGDPTSSSPEGRKGSYESYNEIHPAQSIKVKASYWRPGLYR